MLKQSLNGAWELRQRGDAVTYRASVPGCVHLDLLTAGVIEDPFYRDNELKTLWIGETDWVYRRTFAVDDALLAHDRVLLRCEGLDTLSTLRLNGQPIATTDNMFRTWEFDVKANLRQGENCIEIAFQAALPYVRQKEETVARLYAWGVGQYKANGGGWLRKQPSNFGWDWGPQLTTCGIWRDIALIGINDARIADVNILQFHEPGGAVNLNIHISVERFSSAELIIDAQVMFQKQPVAQQRTASVRASTEINLDIPDPRRWWPQGIGDQHLYDLIVQLRTVDESVIDTQTKRIGLRTLRLARQDDSWGESFQFEVNGVPFFAKGANWIPADTFVARLTEGAYRHLLRAASDANMNMIRVWGGGIYEPDVFYDLCDELGLCVWQDFMFACTTYPTFDASFMANVKAEAEDAVRRIRHHASLALWCGNNELEQGLVADEATEKTMCWADYACLFDDLLKQVVAELSPQTDYWPASPHTPRGDRNDWRSAASGDSHIWQVWHERAPFEFYRTTYHRFVSEFGFQSLPEPRSVEAFTLPQDRNITSFVMEHHQRSLIGNATIVHYMTDWLRLPTSFDMMLWLSQILQGMAVQYAVEHWRRNMPRTMGALYWQLNDCWPVASWSSVDYFGRWKALHYLARHFFAPLLVSAVEDMENGTVDVYVSNDGAENKHGYIEWILTNLEGAIVDKEIIPVTTVPRHSQRIQTLDFTQQLTDESRRNLLLWFFLHIDGDMVASNLLTFARPKHLELCDPGFGTQIHQSGSNFKITLTVEHPALFTWLSLSELDARYSDNFFHMLPGKPIEITLSELPEHMTLTVILRRLVVRSLIDTYR